MSSESAELEAAFMARLAPSWSWIAWTSCMAVGSGLVAFSGIGGPALALFNLWASGLGTGAVAFAVGLRWVLRRKLKQLADGGDVDDEDRQWRQLLQKSPAPRRPGL